MSKRLRAGAGDKAPAEAAEAAAAAAELAGDAEAADPRNVPHVAVAQSWAVLSGDAELTPALAVALAGCVLDMEAAVVRRAAVGRADFVARAAARVADADARVVSVIAELEAAAAEDAARAAAVGDDADECLAAWGSALGVDAAARHASRRAWAAGSAVASDGTDADGADDTLPPDAWPGPSARGADGAQYRGRPLRGYTSGVLFATAEWHAGVPPPKRETWRYLVGRGADGDVLAGRAGRGGGAAAVLNPAMLAAAREALKRPAFPDRGAPLPRAGAGGRGARYLAVAADFDAALRTDASHAAATLATLSAAAADAQ